MAKRSSENKAIKGPPEDKLGRDLATLERDANIDGPTSVRDHKIAVCYNPACPDYRRERVGAEPCSCTRRTVEAR